MAERTTIQVRMEPLALERLDALTHKLTMTRTAVIHLAVARLAELEKIEVDRARQRPAEATDA